MKRKCLKTTGDKVLLLSEKRSKMEAGEATFSSDISALLLFWRRRSSSFCRVPMAVGKRTRPCALVEQLAIAKHCLRRACAVAFGSQLDAE
uniref:Uncharacterized protein n=1 Tax=Globodera rostochiensis TaxID=31243 RepID=A0A914HA55_GLORO